MKKLSFTLIEIVIVIGVIGVVLPTLMSIYYVLLQQQVKVIRLAEVKRQGDYALNFIENSLRNNAVGIYNTTSCGNDWSKPICNTANSSFSSSQNGIDVCFKDLKGNGFAIKDLTGTLWDGQTSLTDPNAVYIQLSPQFTIGCFATNQFSPPIVSISFQICYGKNQCATQVPQDQASLSYYTDIKLKSY